MQPMRDRSKTNSPWFSNEISMALLERDIAMRFWRRHRTHQARQHYRILRNKSTALINRAKRIYYDRLFDDCRDSSTIWKRLRKLGIGKEKSNDSPPFTANEFNRFLSERMIGVSNHGMMNTDTHVAGTPPSTSECLPWNSLNEHLHFSPLIIRLRGNRLHKLHRKRSGWTIYPSVL